MTEYTNDGGASSPADVLVSEQETPSGSIIRHYRCRPPVRGIDGQACADVAVIRRLPHRFGAGAPRTVVVPANSDGTFSRLQHIAEFEGRPTHEEALQRVARVGGEP
jgi:hypothetical protein